MKLLFLAVIAFRSISVYPQKISENITMSTDSIKYNVSIDSLKPFYLIIKNNTGKVLELLKVLGYKENIGKFHIYTNVEVHFKKKIKYKKIQTSIDEMPFGGWTSQKITVNSITVFTYIYPDWISKIGKYKVRFYTQFRLNGSDDSYTLKSNWIKLTVY